MNNNIPKAMKLLDNIGDTIKKENPPEPGNKALPEITRREIEETLRATSEKKVKASVTFNFDEYGNIKSDVMIILRGDSAKFLTLNKTGE